MKRILVAVCLILTLFCSAFAETEKDESRIYIDQEIDLDLCGLNSNIVYAHIYNMMYEPEAFIGKVIRMAGYFNVLEMNETGMIYFSCIVPDATACCAQGIEFIWAGEHVWPDDYLEPGTDIIVTGRLESYMEGSYIYLHLVDAQVEWKNGDDLK